MNQNTPSKQEIAGRLKELSDTMIDIAIDMNCYGGLNEQWHMHACELYAASHIAFEWADGIINESDAVLIDYY